VVTSRPSILYVTDLGYEAQGRRYCDEDLFLTSRLRDDLDLALCHPLDAAALMDRFDGVVVRNSGPVIHYRAQHEAFRAEALARGTRVYNPLIGRGDMAGKQYLVDLSDGGWPVIPTVDRPADLGRLPDAPAYVVKPKAGADSVGLRFVGREELDGVTWDDVLVQPRVDFRYEVSFYFVDGAFQYALRAPDPGRRWVLEPYAATDDDLAFAQRFVDWNTLACGIQRVDGCRVPDGGLLLVELEDLNPYLSLDRLPDAQRERFVDAFRGSLHRFLGG
jgi:hypothetical protein